MIRKTVLGNALVLLTLAIAMAFGAQSRAEGADGEIPWEFTTEGKVVVIGNAFADYDDFTRLLATHNLIDHNNNWIAEDAHLVQTGNIFPRNSDWARLNNLEFEHEKIARLLMKLDKQARAQGGRVHSLHGVLDALFLRWRIDSIPQDVQTLWQTPESDAKREALVERWAKDCDRKNAHFRETTQVRLRRDHDNYMEAFYKPGCVEFLERYGSYNPETDAYNLDTELGAWLRNRNAVVKINDVIYSYGGISPVMAGYEAREGEEIARALTIGEINDLVRARNNNPELFFPADADLMGPIWWTGLAKMGANGVNQYMDMMRERYHARGVVVGVTPQRQTMVAGDVIFVDSGLGSRNIRTKLNSVVIEGDHWTVIEERRPLEEGEFSPLPPEILEGGPDNPQKPGGGPARMDDPGN